MKTASQGAVCYLESVVRGHHIYKKVWTPTLGEILKVFPEPCNTHDWYAVCVKKEDAIVGHVPREQTKPVRYFLLHGGQVTCEVTGRRKLGNGLEVPCVYKFQGREKLVKRMQELITKLSSSSRVSMSYASSC